jgi:iron complex outermembrane recepter protein
MRWRGLILVVLVVFYGNQVVLGADTYDLKPVLVTAQKVEGDIQQVPMSLSVLDAKDLSRTRTFQVEDLSDQVPNLSLRQQTGSERLQRITIRGVGAYSRNIGFDTRAGIYLDGVYMGQSPALNTALFDMERVEVLRGPQGTLYGQNTDAGAINLVSKKPQTDVEAHLALGAGNLSYKNVQATVNAPIVKGKCYGRLSALYRRRDGFYTNLFNGKALDDVDTKAFRVEVSDFLSDRAKFTLSVDGFFSDRESTLGDPLTDTFAISADSVAPGAFDVSYNRTPWEKRDLFGGSGTLEYRLKDGFSLTSISAFRESRNEFWNDIDYSSKDIATALYQDKFRFISQEVRLNSPRGKPGEMTLGLYSSYQKARTFRSVELGRDITQLGDPRLIPGNTVPNWGDVVSQSYAVFVNGGYHVTKRLSLEAGCRYTFERKDADFHLDGSESGLFNIAVWHFDDSDSDSAVTPSGGLTYRFNDHLTAYGIISTGFKSGGFNLDWLTQQDVAAGVTYGKESVINYEAGLKATLPSFGLRANLSIFYALFHNYQVQEFVDLGAGATAIAIKNAAKVTSKGMELEVKLKPAPRWTLESGVSLLDATFDDFPGGGLAGSDASGNDLPFAPHFTAHIGLGYKVPVQPLPATLTIRGDYFHTDSYYSQVSNVRSQPLRGGGNVPFCYTPGYGLFSGEISLDALDERWSATLWVKNLFDKGYVTDSFRGFVGTIVAVRGLPRTFGVDFTYRF